MTLEVPQQRGAAEPSAPLPSAHHDALGPGTRLNEFEIIRVLGAGGFGIVYLALDHVLQRQVAIKEYMPGALAGRGDGAAVSLRAPAHAETFALGLESFVNEARLLAGFDHPALVKVHRFWKANRTAYMAMQYYPGVTLKQARCGMCAPPGEAWLRAFVEPLLGALELLHREGVFHRDIAPDNILLLPEGRPVLLDFGAARRVIGGATQTLTAVLKPSFAPIEQYADVAGMRQGPWTDLYALGATLHYMLTGEAPTPAVLRAVRDVMPALSTPGSVVFADVPAGFLATIDWTLALAPGDRPQSVASLRQALTGQMVPPAPTTRHAIELSAPATQARAVSEVGHTAHVASAAAAAAARAETAAAAAPAAVSGDVPPDSARGDLLAAPAHGRNRRSTWAAWALIGAGVVGAVLWSLRAPLPSAAAQLQAAAVPAASVVRPLLDAPTAAAPQGAAPNRSASAQTGGAAAAAGKSASPAPAGSGGPGHPKGESGAAQQDRTEADRRQASSIAAARSPKAACGDLNFFSLAICVSRQCQTVRWRDHPQCVEPRAIEERRQRRIDQW